MWLDVKLNFNGTPGVAVTVIFGYPNSLLVDVYLPDGTALRDSLQYTYGRADHFTSPIVPVKTMGTYQFAITNSDQSDWSGTLAPNVQISQTEKPYFYYGIAGLILALGYLTFIIGGFLWNFGRKKIKD
jgi:hypothetical protein